MSERVAEYRRLVDELRAARSLPGWKAEDDREVLAQLEDLYGCLSELEQEQVESESRRGWPGRGLK